MPQNPVPNIPRSQENNYGGVKRHHPEHDENIEQNFTDDNQDYRPNGAEYNDTEETRFNAEDRLGHEHHDRPERSGQDHDYKASNYSEGGHGRPTAKHIDETQLPEPE